MLGIKDAEDTAEFLLYHMTPEQRQKFMAERPVLYQRITGVSADVILDRVRGALYAAEKTGA